MAAKTNAQKLQEAIEAGDLETAKALAAKLAPKPKAKPKKKATKPSSKPKIRKVKTEPVKPQPEPAKPIRNATEVPTRPQLGPTPGQVQCRRVSLQGKKFTNTFNPNTYDVKLPPKHAKVDAKLRKADIQPRPGEPGAARDSAEKVRVVCDHCRHSFDVYPWEAERVDHGGRYVCNRCIH